MSPLYGWAPRGERASGSVPYGSWKRLTVLGALSVRGTEGVMSIAGSTTRAVFEAYLSHVLLPGLKQTHPAGAILVLDNLSSHKSKTIETLVKQAGFTLKYLPRYSPDLSPIEPCWSKFKDVLWMAEARTVETLTQAVLDAITPQTLKAGSSIAGIRSPATPPVTLLSAHQLCVPNDPAKLLCRRSRACLQTLKRSSTN